MRIGPSPSTVRSSGACKPPYYFNSSKGDALPGGEHPLEIHAADRNRRNDHPAEQRLGKRDRLYARAWDRHRDYEWERRQLPALASIEVYESTRRAHSRLSTSASRGCVGGESVIIGGLIVGGSGMSARAHLSFARSVLAHDTPASPTPCRIGRSSCSMRTATPSARTITGKTASRPRSKPQLIPPSHPAESAIVSSLATATHRRRARQERARSASARGRSL